MTRPHLRPIPGWYGRWTSPEPWRWMFDTLYAAAHRAAPEGWDHLPGVNPYPWGTKARLLTDIASHIETWMNLRMRGENAWQWPRTGTSPEGDPHG